MKRANSAWFVAAAWLLSAAAFGQGFDFFGPPNKPGGDLSGDWAPGRFQDADLGTAAGMMVDYGGIPINEGSRLYALAWSASRITLLQHQCPGYAPPYFYTAPGNYRIWEERDPHTQRLTAIMMYGQIAEGLRTGRARAPSGICTTHVVWIFHRQVGRQCPDCLHHAYQARLDSGAWCGSERRSDSDGALHSAR